MHYTIFNCNLEVGSIGIIRLMKHVLVVKPVPDGGGGGGGGAAGATAQGPLLFEGPPPCS